MIDFPNSPSVGQIFNSGTGPIYVWDGVAWSLITPSNPVTWEPVEVLPLSSVTQYVKTGLDAFRDLRIAFNAGPDVTATQFVMQFSADNGSSWFSGGVDYFYQHISSSSTTVGGNSASASSYIIGFGQNINPGGAGNLNTELIISDFNKTRWATINQNGGLRNSALASYTFSIFGGQASGVVLNAFRITAGQAFSGRIIVEGCRG